MGDVMVTCRRCGRKESSSSFVLDPHYRMVVCPGCVKERMRADREETKAAAEPQKKTTKSTPPGWDAEDEYLERKVKEKVPEPMSTRPDGKISCRKCKYVFRYDPAEDKPKVCPYCATPVKGRRF